MSTDTYVIQQNVQAARVCRTLNSMSNGLVTLAKSPRTTPTSWLAHLYACLERIQSNYGQSDTYTLASWTFSALILDESIPHRQAYLDTLDQIMDEL